MIVIQSRIISLHCLAVQRMQLPDYNRDFSLNNDTHTELSPYLEGIAIGISVIPASGIVLGDMD